MTYQYPTNKRLLNLEKLADTYRLDSISITYKDKTKANEQNYLKIPINFDLIVRLKAYILHDTDTDTLTISKALIGDNYWITQLLDDHKNKRIDITQYHYDLK